MGDVLLERECIYLLHGKLHCADWLIRKSMTDSYVPLVPPKSMSLGGHFEFWAANGPKWPPQKMPR